MTASSSLPQLQQICRDLFVVNLDDLIKGREFIIGNITVPARGSGFGPVRFLNGQGWFTPLRSAGALTRDCPDGQVG